MLSIFIELKNQSDETQFDYILSNFKPDTIYVKETQGFSVSSKVMNEAVKVESAQDLPIDIPLVLFLPKLAPYITPTTSLLDFTHPTDAIYMFGPNHRHLSVDDDFTGRGPDHVVYIPTDTNDDMYSWNAAAIALWVRRHG